jgi:2-polyprenyl-3-methyl-5-hydroxy-6-metoxy-1,4-benzoquinol methylase
MNIVNCPLCKKSNTFLYTVTKDYQKPAGNRYNAYKCPDCNIIFQNPFPLETDFDNLYPDNYYAHVESEQIPFLTRMLQSFLQGKARLFAFFLSKRLFPYLDIVKKSHKILDIGCGKGLFLDVLKKLGKETHGLEPDVNAMKILEKHGHCFHKDISSIESDSFDVVTMFQVFEHLEEPEVWIREISRILKSGGSFILETPNAASRLAKNKNFWRALEFPRHLILHSPNSIRQLFASKNLQTQVLTRVSPTDIKETFFLKRNIKSSGMKKVLSFCLLPYILLQYVFNAGNGSLLIVMSKKIN